MKIKGLLIGVGVLFTIGLFPNVVHADTPRVDMVDVSNHNGQMTAPEFTYMRNNYGLKAVVTKISEGVGFHDWTAMGNIASAKQAGLYINGYHYLRSTTVAGAIQEAQYAVNMAKADGLPVGAVLAVDIENQNQIAMGRAMQPVAKAFENEVARYGGYRSTTYTGGSAISVSPDGEKAWIAQYPYVPTADMKHYSTEHAWQWTSKQTFASSLGVFDANILYDNFFTAGTDKNAVVPNVTPSKTVVNKNATITVWGKNGVWYTDKSLRHKANGIIKHVGSYWSFKDGKLIKNGWTKQWGHYYWSDKNGKLIQGTGTWHNVKWNFGTNGTYYVKSGQLADVNKLIAELNK